MKKRLLQTNWHLRKLYGRYCNLQKKIRHLIQSGQFFGYSTEWQNRMVHRLQLLYQRLQRSVTKQNLRWATAALGLILSATAVKAGYNGPVSLSGVAINADLERITACDFDKDGDDDIIIGYLDGYIQYVRNDNGKFIGLKGIEENPFDTLPKYELPAPTLGDVDKDGDLDLVVGDYDGFLHFIKNEAGVYIEKTGSDNPFNGIDLGKFTSPSLTDMDNDGDADLVVGEFYGSIHYYKNEAGVFVEQLDTDNPFDGVNFGISPTLAMPDYDEDGDFDLFVGDKFGYINYYKNNAGSFDQQLFGDNPFEGDKTGTFSSPAILDVDMDGDFDLLTGSYEYSNVNFLNYFNNEAGDYVLKEGTFNPLEGIAVGYFAAPTFGDIDGDSDLDLIVGDGYGLHSFENVGDGFIALPDSLGLFNDNSEIEYSKPLLFDFDKDDDLDLIVGDIYGTIHYFENDTATFTEKFDAENPFEGIGVGYSASPALIDIDVDGDFDLFVGEKYGTIHYFNNDAGNFVEVIGAENPFNGVDIGAGPSLNFADYDGDSDMDLFVGDKYGDGSIHYFKNNAGVFTELTGSDNPVSTITGYAGISPAMADIDGDGDLDCYFGTYDGKFYVSTYSPTGINVNAGSGLTTTEAGGTALFSLQLNSQPTENVKINISSSNTAEGTVNPVSVTIVPSEWMDVKTITVTGVDDSEDDGSVDYNIDFSVISTDPEYSGYSINSLSATNNDNDGISAVKPLTAGSINVSSIQKTIYLSMGEVLVDKVEVYGLQGNLIASEQVGQTGNYSFDLSSAASGIYLVKVYSGESVINTKVLLK